MKEAKFDEIWDNAIKPILDHKLFNDKQLYTTDGTSNQSGARRDMKSWYESSRDRIKLEFMQKPSGRLDRHKICACIFKAIIEVKILKVRNGSLEKDLLVNAEVAFLASCVVLSSFMLADAKGADPGFEEFLSKRKMPCFPNCKNSDSNDSYVVQTIKTLCHDQRHGHLSILALANIFCWLEAYTELACKSGAAAINPQ
jgi:hypothetical protein